MEINKLEELLQDYIIGNDRNGLNLYCISYLDDSINQKKTYEKEISKEIIFKQLENHTYKASDIYKLLSEGKITAVEIIKHTSIEVYDMLMDELNDFDKKSKNNNHKITSTDTFSDKKEKVISEIKGSKNSEEMLLEISKKVMDFLADAKEILVIKK